jgi:hypothetical protein
VYPFVGRPLVSAVLDGINCAIICYGQTTAGKTHTMVRAAVCSISCSLFLSPHCTSGTLCPLPCVLQMGPVHRRTGIPTGMVTSSFIEPSVGLIPRMVQDIFRTSQLLPAHVKMTVRASYIEIYVEQVHDLIMPRYKPLKLRDFGDLCFTDAAEVPVTSASEVMAIIGVGNSNRHVGKTAVSKASSRSHAILQLTVTTEDARSKLVRTAILNLVDLAGSERSTQTGGDRTRMIEAAQINQSLLALVRG